MPPPATRRFSARRLLPVLAVLTAAGCAGEPTPVPVSGTMRVDGKPVGPANLGFAPVAGGRNAIGSANAAGEFTVPGGLVPGEYAVSVVPTTPQFDIRNPKAVPPGSPFPPQYADPAKTPLRVTVPPPGPVTLELSSRPPP